MGLTDSQKKMIEWLSMGNIENAKKQAIICLEEDTTEKNANYKRRVLFRFGNSAKMIELPHDLQKIVCVEDQSFFQEQRFYLSMREREVYKNIALMRLVSKRLAEKNIKYANTTLLYGESGTGKTTFGRYVAYKFGLPFCYINFSQLVDSLLGGTAKNINKVFSYAASNACVLMLDEIDCISIRRSDAGNSCDSEMARITITLMQELDKLPGGVVVLAATNRRDRIDEALLRRFYLHHEIKVLEEREKIALVDAYLTDIKMTLPETVTKKMIAENRNQSKLIDTLIRAISVEIACEIQMAMYNDGEIDAEL